MPPEVQKWEYRCPVTGQVVLKSEGSLPDGWFRTQGEVFHPRAQLIMARRTVNVWDTEQRAITTVEIGAPATAEELASVGLR